MKCPSCGADISADALSCMYCNSSVPASETRHRSTTFARLKASAAFANSRTPERLARLPKVSAMQKVIMLFFFAMFIGVSAFICFVALAMAGVVGVIGGAATGGPGAAVSIVPLIFAIFPIGFMVLGIILLSVAKKKIDNFASAPARAVPVIVVDKRTHVWGGRGKSSAKTDYFVTCETEDGTREEYQIWDGTMYGKMSAGDAGILFEKANHGLDFDRVRA